MRREVRPWRQVNFLTPRLRLISCEVEEDLIPLDNCAFDVKWHFPFRYNRAPSLSPYTKNCSPKFDQPPLEGALIFSASIGAFANDV